jgi:hypothetical protein
VRGKLARPVREETDGKGPGHRHLTGSRLHSTGGSWKRSTLATVIGESTAARETSGRQAPSPTARARHRASSRPYNLCAGAGG